ncbi:MAG TPA: acyl-CoA thioesterase domain-containing protein [Euzebya sp.]|nr:acyl-CoA thioesterase domain-containing protein [Euzebya sp.]
MTDLARLLTLLDIETIDDDLYRGLTSIGRRTRVYGGQVAAQALVAAGRTVQPDRFVHSLHAYFMRPGDATIPIVYDVDRLRDGRSFTTRRVRARQRGKAIFTLEASFQVIEPDGLTHQPAPPPAPDPQSLPRMSTLAEQAEGSTSAWGELLALDFRSQEPQAGEDPEAPMTSWFRATGQVGEDPLTHAAIITYASDFTLLSNVLTRHGRWFGEEDLMIASLDHAMWFHQPRLDASHWMLYETTSPAAGGSRGLGFGRIYDQDGTLLVSTAQEGLTRLIG